MSERKIQFFFNLPYALHLKDGKYSIVLGTESSTVLIEKIFRYPSSDSNEKGSVVEYDLTDQKIILAHGVEQPEDDLGEISYTKVRIDTEISESTYNEIIQKTDKFDLRPLLVPTVNKLINAYRIIGKEVYSRPIIPEDIRFLGVKFVDAKEGEHKGLCLRYNAKGGVVMASACIKSDEVHDKIAEFVARSDSDYPFYEEILLNSRHLEYKGNYRMSVVEAIIALEAVLPDFLFKKWKLLDFSNNAIETKMKKLDLHDMLSFELLLVCPAVDRRLVDDVKGINTIRNKIIHQGFKDVSKSDALKAIEKVSELINYLNSNLS